MLYVFNVISGSIIEFEMKLTLEKVAILKEAIQRKTNTQVQNQVLLISGGKMLEDALEEKKKDKSSGDEAIKDEITILDLGAGTDTSPIFFFPLKLTEMDILSAVQLEHPQDLEAIKEKIEESKHLPASYITLFSRSQLAQKVYEYSLDTMNNCEKVISYQHLQQQGWAAAIACLDEVLSKLKTKFETFETTCKDHMVLREHWRNLVSNYEKDMELLQKIPLFPALSSSVSYRIGVISDLLHNDDKISLPLHSSETTKEMLTLHDWVTRFYFRDIKKELMEYKIKLDMMDQALCKKICEQYNAIVMKTIAYDREIGGLEDRLFGLQVLLRDGKKSVAEQKTFADSFTLSQKRASSVRDESICSELCKSQVPQLEIMLQQYEKIREIRKRCFKAREELSININIRLQFITYILDKINNLSCRLLLTIKNMGKIKSQLRIYEQIHTCPKLYFDTVAEVIRRHHFAHNFSAWALQLSQENKKIWDEEVAIRENFVELIATHFLSDMFSGLMDIPPAFATEPPEAFDQDLPKLIPENLQLLNELVPEICSQVTFSERDGIPPILDHPWPQTVINSEGKSKIDTETFTSAIFSTTAHKANSKELKSDPPNSPDHFIASRPTSLIRDHPESETDTEEFEKVCGSISDGTYSPMEPERNVSLTKTKSRSSHEATISPLNDRLQSPPSQLLHEFVTVQCNITEEGGSTSQIMLQNFTHNNLIDALHSEAQHLKEENLSQDDLKAVVLRLGFIISKLTDVKMESLSTSTLKKTHDQIELKNNLLNDAHREIEIYQSEIQKLQASNQQLGIEFDEEKRQLQTQHMEAIKHLSLENELEIETIQRKVEERSEELGVLKIKLHEVELTLRKTELENNSLSTKINELENIYREREKEAIIKEQRKLLEENIRDKQKQENHFTKTLESSLSDLRVQLEREFSEKWEKEKVILENEAKKELLKCSQLWEAQTELLVNQKSKELSDELMSKHESELENAKIQHKMEIESLRSRFRMMTMDRSPSETSLEKVERGDFIEASVHELALMKIREEFNKEKEVALNELRKCLEETNNATLKNEIHKLEENRKKIEAQKQEEFNSVVKSVTLDKERVIENLRLRVEFLTEENEKHLKHSSPSKLSEEQIQQQHSCEVHKKKIDQLEKEIHRLKRLSFISERHSDVSETGAAQVTSSSAVEPPSASSTSYPEEIKRLQQVNSDLNQALIRFRDERPPKISMFSCQPFDFVLIIWDDLYSHYRILLEGQSALHFVHSESYVLLCLSKESPNKLFCLAEVVRKEFCQAKKDENRFRVPKGTKFYRVICRPSKALTPLAEIERAEIRQRKSSVIGSPPGLQSLSTISLPSKPSEGELVIPSSDAEFLNLKDVLSEQKPDCTSETPGKKHRDSTQESST